MEAGLDSILNAQAMRTAARTLDTPRDRFDDRLAIADAALDRVDVDRREQARRAAEDLVAQAFLAPMLASMRDDPFKSDLLGGGFAEDAFTERLHVELREAMTRGRGWSLVEAIVDRMPGLEGGGSKPSLTGGELDRHG